MTTLAFDSPNGILTAKQVATGIWDVYAKRAGSLQYDRTIVSRDGTPEGLGRVYKNFCLQSFKCNVQ